MRISSLHLHALMAVYLSSCNRPTVAITRRDYDSVVMDELGVPQSTPVRQHSSRRPTKAEKKAAKKARTKEYVK